MNVEIGTEAALFPEKEYINGIFVAVWILVKNTRVCLQFCWTPEIVQILVWLISTLQVLFVFCLFYLFKKGMEESKVFVSRHLEFTFTI